MKINFKKFLTNPKVLLAIILLIALVVRLLEINKTSFWYDEAFTGNTVMFPWKEMFEVIARDKVHPPLYYIMTKSWGLLLGYSQTTLRSFSILWGMLTIPVAYLLGRDLFDKKGEFPKTGLVAAFMLAVSPFFITYSIEARSYSFLGFLALVLAYFVLKYLKTTNNPKEKTKFLVLSVVVAIVMCSTHYYQVIYIIGIVCAMLTYTYIYTEKGVNKKLLYGSSIFAVSILLILFFLPIKQYLQSKGLEGSWWVPTSRLDDIVRVHYSYLFGVVRYANGVPPARELMISVSPQVLAGIIFLLHVLGFSLIVNNKKVDLEVKRSLVFLFVLSIITFIGFMTLSLLNYNTFVERYMIAPGVVLVMSLAVTLSFVFEASKWKVVTALTIYLILIHLLRPLPPIIDYRIVADGLTKENASMNIQRDIFQSPADMINTMFYTDRSKAYYLFNFQDEYEGWALINNDRGVNLEDITANDLFIVTKDQESNFVGASKGFRRVSILDNNLVVLQKYQYLQ